MSGSPVADGLERFAEEIRESRARAFRRKLWTRAGQGLTIVAVLLLWEAAVRLLGVDPIILPSVTMILEAGWSMTVDGTIPWHAFVTLRRVLLGFAAAAVLGISVGVAMNRFRVARTVCDPLIAALYPLPKITLIPLLIIWFGSGETYKFVIAAATAFFPIVINTFHGLRQVDEELVGAAGDLGADDWNIQREIMIPAATPAILAGCRLGMGVAIILTIASEMIASQDGLGQILITTGAILETESVFAILFVVAAIGLVITKIHDWVDLRLAGWAFEDRGS